MKFEYTRKLPEYGKVIGEFRIIDDGVPFDEESFVKFAKAEMHDDAPFGCTVQRGTDRAYLTIYID